MKHWSGFSVQGSHHWRSGALIDDEQRNRMQSQIVGYTLSFIGGVAVTTILAIVILLIINSRAQSASESENKLTVVEVGKEATLTPKELQVVATAFIATRTPVPTITIVTELDKVAMRMAIINDKEENPETYRRFKSLLRAFSNTCTDFYGYDQPVTVGNNIYQSYEQIERADLLDQESLLDMTENVHYLISRLALVAKNNQKPMPDGICQTVLRAYTEARTEQFWTVKKIRAEFVPTIARHYDLGFQGHE